MKPHSYLVLENYIGGKFLPCRSHVDSYDPSTGEVYCRVPDSGEEEVGDPGTNPGFSSFFFYPSLTRCIFDFNGESVRSACLCFATKSSEVASFLT